MWFPLLRRSEKAAGFAEFAAPRRRHRQQPGSARTVSGLGENCSHVVILSSSAVVAASPFIDGTAYACVTVPLHTHRPSLRAHLRNTYGARRSTQRDGRDRTFRLSLVTAPLTSAKASAALSGPPPVVAGEP